MLFSQLTIYFSDHYKTKMQRLALFLICSTFLTFSLAQDIPPQNPVIGIFTQTYENTTSSKSSYIAASYIKFIEMSGAQVVPIYSFAETSQIINMLGKINGVFFPGGDMDFHINQRWTKNADVVFKFAKQQNDKGNVFPIFGTCMGIQLLAYLTSNYNDTILTRVHGDEAIVLPITFLQESYIFATLNPTQKQKLTKGQGLMYYNHHWAVTLDTFYSNTYLKGFWNLISTSVTPYNQRFVASFEAKNYPFYGVQFHPEKSPFEWKINADRSLQAIEIVQIISNRFVEMARKNKNRFVSATQFTTASIYNFETKPTNMSFTQIYVFNQNPITVSIQEE